jgi:hypothetical protein
MQKKTEAVWKIFGFKLGNGTIIIHAEDLPTSYIPPCNFEVKSQPEKWRIDHSKSGIYSKTQRWTLDKQNSNWLPSGKRLHNYGKPPFLMGKSTINGNFQ